MILYLAHCIANGSIYYGKTAKTLEQRKARHFYDAKRKSNNSWFHAAIRKYGEEGFTWHILGVFSSEEELNNSEKWYIAISREVGHRIYNISNGGDGGAKINQKKRSPTESERLRISQSLKDYYAERPGTMTGRKGHLCPSYGRKHLEESKKKMSEAKMGWAGMTGKSNGSAKSVFCTTTGEHFEIASDAAKKYKSDLSSIIKCCKGKVGSVKGKHYVYASDVKSGLALRSEIA